MSRILITGGAGFVGVNLADFLLERGHEVALYDNLSRAGVQNNLDWLEQSRGGSFETHIADIRDGRSLRDALAGVDVVYHLAAQVAVTASLDNPLHDFAVNAQGTLTLLEEIRAMDRRAGLIFTSTNKVYGALEDIGLHAHWNRYEPDDPKTARSGIGEERRLSFRSPYGCSKGAADQYVLDYALSYGIPAVVFRMSCIYGPHQMGNEDQGWVAHFVSRALNGQPITIYGDGKQVRDILYIDDLLAALYLAKENIETLAGRAFNIGGGPKNTISLVELTRIITSLCRCAPRISFADWRKGDQRYFVSDCAAFQDATGWQPRVNVNEGVARLYEWLGQTVEAEAPAVVQA